jgi:hypothetical protein
MLHLPSGSRNVAAGQMDYMRSNPAKLMNSTLFQIFAICSASMYFLVASQGGFYLLVFAKVLRIMPTADFLQIRNIIDTVIESRLKILYRGTAVCMISWTLLFENPGIIAGKGLLLLSTLLFLADLILALRVSIPLNKLIRHISDASTSEAGDVKRRWLRFIIIRACISVSGFAILVIHLMTRA